VNSIFLSEVNRASPRFFYAAILTTFRIDVSKGVISARPDSFQAAIPITCRIDVSNIRLKSQHFSDDLDRENLTVCKVWQGTSLPQSSSREMILQKIINLAKDLDDIISESIFSPPLEKVLLIPFHRQEPKSFLAPMLNLAH
jgi:hypothetical protein